MHTYGRHAYERRAYEMAAYAVQALQLLISKESRSIGGCRKIDRGDF